jgi:hypothetical protein
MYLRIISTAVFSLLAVLFASCGSDGRTNCSKNGISDCKEGEECLYSGNQEDDYYCLLRCSAKDDCPPGQDCTGSASSCMTCMDYINVCE